MSIYIVYIDNLQQHYILHLRTLRRELPCMASFQHAGTRKPSLFSTWWRLHAANQFSAANLSLAGFPLTNALGENLPSHH